jgi:hypothetical protein
VPGTPESQCSLQIDSFAASPDQYRCHLRLPEAFEQPLCRVTIQVRSVSSLTRPTRLLGAYVTESLVLGLASAEVGGLARTICGQCKPVISAADIS